MRHLPLCSNTHHSIHYRSPNSTPRVPGCSGLHPNAPNCTQLHPSIPTVLRYPLLHPPRLRPKFLFARVSCTCYMYTPHMAMSTPNRYRHGLEKLTGEPPATKTALISILLPEIETALASGKTRRQIWQRLVEDGFDLSYHTFHSTLWRVQRKPRITAAMRRKTPKVSKGEAEQLTEEVGHDPLVNLRRVEQSRPGFHYRGTENLDVLVHGRRESREQTKR